MKHEARPVTEVREETRTTSPQATQRLGARIARGLMPGAVVGLFGELGSGKTCLVQGVCRGLGVKDRVTSPSFVVINEYAGCLAGCAVPVYHLDLYRLADPAELYELGYEEYLYGDGICLIEWAERAGEVLPNEALRVYLTYVSDHERDVALCRGASPP